MATIAILALIFGPAIALASLLYGAESMASWWANLTYESRMRRRLRRLREYQSYHRRDYYQKPVRSDRWN